MGELENENRIFSYTYLRSNKPFKIKKLEVNIKIYIPTTENDEMIAEETIKERLKEVKNFLSSISSGYTINQVAGNYFGTEEQIYLVSTNIAKQVYLDNENKIISWLESRKMTWGQKRIGFEFEGDFYLTLENVKTL